ncbi:MAG: hypothetical protein WC350_04235 [Candidatus Micrarchaeia archaeon]|jgi:hypothetical protein
MNPIGKPKEARLVGLTRDGKPVFVLPAVNAKPRNAEQIKLADKFCRANLIGGTLVTYADGFRFSMEEGRAEVAKVLLGNGGLGIKTKGGDVPLLCAIIDIITFSEKRGVFYLEVPCIGCYAVAPKGTVIPKKETKDEALADSERLLNEGMAGVRMERTERAAGQTALEKLRATDFVGGTIVERLVLCETEVERNRKEITKVTIRGTQLIIDTDGRNGLFAPDINTIHMKTDGDIFIIYGQCSCYVLARKGVDIPPRPSIEQITDAVKVLAGDKE